MALQDLEPYVKELSRVTIYTAVRINHMFRHIATLRAESTKEFSCPYWPNCKCETCGYRNANEATIIGIKKRIAQSNMRFAVKISKLYAKPSHPIGECVSIANFAMMIAIEKYDVNRGYCFTTYCGSVIKMRLLEFVRDHPILTRSIVHRISCVSKAVSRLWKFGVNRPTDQQIVDDLNTNGPPSGRGTWNTKSVHILRRREKLLYREPYKPTRFDLADPAVYDADTTDILDNTVLIKKIERKLDARQRFVIWHRFGLGGNHPHTLEEVGHAMGLTKERVRQIEQRALYMLKEYLCHPQNGNGDGHNGSKILV